MCFEIIFSLRLWDRHHDVANEDRPSLLRLFRRIVYAESSEAFDKAQETMEDKSSLPIGLAELWESEPIGTCKNNNPIHDQGCGYNYLDDRPSK